ncbi:MAG: hypothetical protein GC160_24510 [Acidobacteria bacterium]|nr:hypothetical protein [Acidobacteriota bacterium]
MRSRSAPFAPRVASAASDHFPLHVGDSWTYVLEGRTAGDEARSIVISETAERNGVTYYRLEGWPTIGSALIRLNSRGQLVALDQETGAEKLWYDFAAPVRASWTPETGDECTGQASVVDRNAKVETPAGTFEGALEIHYEGSPCADAGVVSEIFAPGVGLLQRTETTIAGPLTWQLTRAQVGGRTVEAPGLSFSIQIDRPSYSPDVEPPVTDPNRVTPSMRVRLTIANRSPLPLSLTFPSPQFFDLEVRNAAGETVYFWSADKLFPAVITELALSPGERVFEVDVPLLAGSTPLPAGTYVVEGWLVVPEGRLYSASVPFEVTGGK